MTREMEVKDEKLEKQIQKQIGCMAGFFHIFDRHPYSVKRLPSSISTVSIHSIILSLSYFILVLTYIFTGTGNINTSTRRNEISMEIHQRSSKTIVG